jgi:hypothetical protein
MVSPVNPLAAFMPASACATGPEVMHSKKGARSTKDGSNVVAKGGWAPSMYIDANTAATAAAAKSNAPTEAAVEAGKLSLEAVTVAAAAATARV